MDNHLTESRRIFQTGRPGRPIGKETWNRFLESGSWEDAPRIFGRLYDDRRHFPPVVSEGTEGADAPWQEGKRLSGHEKDRKRYYRINMVLCGKVFADEVDKNRMLRILTGEIVRWQLPVVDFVLLDDGLHLIVCREEGRNTKYVLSRFTESLEAKYAVYYIQSRGTVCTFMTDHVLYACGDHLKALEECCRIHALPVSRGIVEDIREYWFSGYLSIQGRYAWDCMDPTSLLADIADQPGKAVRFCEAAHRSYLREIRKSRPHRIGERTAGQKEK